MFGGRRPRIDAEECLLEPAEEDDWQRDCDEICATVCHEEIGSDVDEVVYNQKRDTESPGKKKFFRGGKNSNPNSSKWIRYETDEVSLRKISGLHWVTTALFIVADIAGGGIVAIPIGMLKSGGIVGLLLIIVICSAFCYTAHLLGKNWVLMCSRWPELHREHCRKPYPEMAYRSMGENARLFTSFTLQLMLFGVSVVYLLLSAKIMSDLLASTVNGQSSVGPCLMVVVLAVSLLPISFLKSPQSFWWAVVTAMLTTTFSAILILSGILMDYKQCVPEVNHPAFRFSEFSLSIGIFFFSFGGHGVFPTIQHDMKNPRRFTRSSILAYIIVLAMYLPISLLGYEVYGDSLHESIINSIQTPFIQKAANLFIAIHCILTLTIVINPLNQELEHFYNIPHHFGWQRVIVRSGLMASVVFIAVSVPSFGPILNLIGGTTVALTSAILPCLFSLFLEASNSVSVSAEKELANHHIPSMTQVLARTRPWKLVLNLSVIALAIVCGFATTRSAISEIATSSFSAPCYLPSYDDIRFPTIVQPTHCCGAFRNVSKNPYELTCPVSKRYS